MKTNRLAILLFTLVTATAMDGQQESRLRFDPPAPTERTAVTVRGAIVNHLGCSTRAIATRNGRSISIVPEPEQCPITSPPSPTLVTFEIDLGVLPAGVYDVIVGYGNLRILLAETKLVVRESAPAFRVSATRQGQLAAITGMQLPECPENARCAAPAVLVNGQTIQLLTTPHGIYFPTGTLAAGTYDVTLIAGGVTRTVVAALDVWNPDAPPDATVFEPILLPTLFSGNGAQGARWITEANAHGLAQHHGPFALPLPQPPPADSSPVPPFATWTVPPATQVYPNGYVLHVARAASEQASFSLLVRDLSRDAQAFGTSIPVVREHELFDRPFSLMNVPVDARYRTTLRVYGVVPAEHTTVHLRIYPLSSNRALVDDLIDLPQPRSIDEPAVVAIADLRAMYPAVANEGAVRVEISPSATSGPRLWALATVTNNTTQHVTVVAPE